METTLPAKTEEQSQIKALNKLEKAIAECSSISETKEMLDQVVAMKIYMKRIKASYDAQIKLARIKVLTERKIGEMCAEMPTQQTIGLKKGKEKPSVQVEGTEQTKKQLLKSAGLSESDAYRYELLSRIPLPTFETYIKYYTANSSETRPITTKAMLRYYEEMVRIEKSNEECSIKEEERIAKIEGSRQGIIVKTPYLTLDKSLKGFAEKAENYLKSEDNTTDRIKEKPIVIGWHDELKEDYLISSIIILGKIEMINEIVVATREIIDKYKNSEQEPVNSSTKN